MSQSNLILERMLVEAKSNDFSTKSDPCLSKACECSKLQYTDRIRFKSRHQRQAIQLMRKEGYLFLPEINFDRLAGSSQAYLVDSDGFVQNVHIAQILVGTSGPVVCCFHLSKSERGTVLATQRSLYTSPWFVFMSQ